MEVFCYLWKNETKIRKIEFVDEIKRENVGPMLT